MENNTRDPIQQAKWHVLVVYGHQGCSAQRGLLDISQEGLKAI